MRGLSPLPPLRRRKIAVAVLAEHMGHGGSAAAPLAKDVIEAYVKLIPQVPTVTLRCVAPTKRTRPTGWKQS